MEYEYETLCADSVENCKAIVDWMFSGPIYVQSQLPPGDYSRSAVGEIHRGRTYRRKKPAADVLLTDIDDIPRGIIAGVVEFRYPKSKDKKNWSIACAFGEEWIRSNLKEDIQYRIKPGHTLPPKKVKKLVDRKQEDFWPLIGRYWARNKDGRRYIIACDHWNNAADSQANWQIAPLGSEEWGPMQKSVEVDA
jgi:hypothetical protein